MNPLAGIRIKIAIKQEICKQTHTKQFVFLVAASVLAFFMKKVTIDERK